MPEIVARYAHPQGSTITVYDNDAIVKVNPKGKVVATSATAEKLRAGHGGWTPIAVDADVPAAPLAAAKAAPTVTLKPMKFKQAELDRLTDFIESPAWVLQQKLDGIRVQIVFDGGAPWFRNSTGGRLDSAVAHATTNQIAAVLPHHPEGAPAYTVDGEVVGGVFWAFDLVNEGNEDLPFETRLELLRRWHEYLADTDPKITALVRVLPTAHERDDKAQLSLQVYHQGGEGWIAKRLDSPYNWGARVEHSLKVKLTHTVDVVVTERNRDGKSNMVLSLHRDGVLVEVGSASAIGKPDAKVGDVVEIRYLYAGSDGRLTQPTVLRIRDDKPAADCTADQLRFADKAVVAL